MLSSVVNAIKIKAILVYGVIMCTVYFIITLAYIHLYIISKRKIEYYEEKQKEYENIILYTNIIEDMLYDRRKFIHDFQNIMLSLKGLIDNEDIKGLKEYYYKEVLREKRKLDNRNIYYIKHVKNLSLKGLLTTKIQKCSYLKLDIHVEIFEDIEDMSIESVDICRIVGILMDNAIEAAKSSLEKKIFVSIHNEENNVTILIANSFSVKPDLKKIFEKDYSGKGVDRGLGLYIVKDIIDRKYENVLLNTSIEDNLFIQEIIVLD